ncbi:hypothetical protein QQ045_017631 [Rhodiola kirilowii]
MKHILCWNARGANNAGTIDYYKTMMSTHKFSLCAILEPMSGTDRLTEFARKVNMPNYMHGDVINPKVWILWNDAIQVSHINTRDRYISVLVNDFHNTPFTCTFVYAFVSQTKRRELWNDLLMDAQSMAGPWVVAGDFNVISSWSEKKGAATRDTGAMFEFNNFQMQAGLSDAGFSGNKFTWCNNRSADHQIWMRLDRVLINGPAMAVLPTFKIAHLPRIASDHNPLLIDMGDETRRLASFKYLRAWHDHAEFLAVVEGEWHKHTHPNPILAFAIKLKALRRRLKDWNWNVFGNISLKIKALVAKVDLLEHDIQTDWTQSLETELVTTKDDLSRTQCQHFQMLTDKANAHWVAEGDRNTTLFHAMIKARRSNNSIKLDMPDGSTTSDRRVIGPLALEHFSSILGAYSAHPSTNAFTNIDPIITE